MIGTLMRLWMELMSGRSLLLLSRCLVTGEKVNTWCEKPFRIRYCGMGAWGREAGLEGKVGLVGRAQAGSKLQQQCR